ncbi:ribonuclease III domain-containing protein [Dissophora ornata]|nr:ribonuclease III domain-containing protein [Dissophora ornata]
MAGSGKTSGSTGAAIITGQTTWGPHPLEQLFERTFRTKGLVHLALRHRSVSKGENNCRLQYVGDAVWDVAADLFWIRHCLAPEQAGPGKANTVSNKALSIMAVELGISELLEVGLSLGGCIDETVKKLQGMANKGSSFCQPENISSMKLFADEFEAVVGALFIDAGLDLAPVEAFFEKRVVPMLTKQLPQYAFQ